MALTPALNQGANSVAVELMFVNECKFSALIILKAPGTSYDYTVVHSQEKEDLVNTHS